MSFLYIMCGAFRLAQYNVQAMRPRVLAEGTTKVDKKSFVGLPIPAAAVVLAAMIDFHPDPIVHLGGPRSLVVSSLLMALVGCLGVLMVSTLRYSSLKSVGTGRANVRLVIMLTTLGLMGSWLRQRPAIAAAYALHGFDPDGPLLAASIN